MGTALILVIFLPLIASLLIGVLVQKVGHARIAWFALPFPVISFVTIFWMAFARGEEMAVVVSRPWVPMLGLDIAFLVDGLSIFFGLVVSGVGILIFLYAIGYFGGKGKNQGKFFAFLLLFMAAMLGTVFSDNLVLLFTFWELTGLASFLLIGFNHEDEGSRAGARAALLITMLTGLFMLAGIIMLGMVTGTYSLRELSTTGVPFAENEVWLNAALVLMLLGAFGKSAQFPFHFWLPNAMAAPTPVSAYLHSATMVKLGVFLCARLFASMHDAAMWTPLLGWVGFFTMVYAAWLALRSNDLKSILAYSTVSALGYFIGMYGLGGMIGLKYDFMHVLAHMLFKASLFMMVGVVDHAAGTRDIRKLGGLAKRLPILVVVTGIGCASMAGIPLTLGFLSKEHMLTDALAAVETLGTTGWIWACMMITAAILKVAFAARLFWHIFYGPEPKEITAHYHDPGIFVQLPPLILATGTLVLGALPWLLNIPLEFLTVEGLQDAADAPRLALYHGFTTELMLSGSVILLGAGVYWIAQRMNWRFTSIPRLLQFDAAFEWGILAFNSFTKKITRFLRAETPMDYLPVIILGMLAMFAFFLGKVALSQDLYIGDLFVIEPEFSLLRIFTGILIMLSVLGVVALYRWTSQLISLSAAGFLITFYFVLYKAPDLALTQILIESATVLLILLLLSRFPHRAQEGKQRDAETSARRRLALMLAISVGCMVTALMLIAGSNPHPDPIGPRFLATTVEFAKGTNTVNTILVDYRGIDTMGEIAVLLIALLGSIGLLARYKRDPFQSRQGALGQPGFGLPHLHEKKDSREEKS